MSIRLAIQYISHFSQVQNVCCLFVVAAVHSTSSSDHSELFIKLCSTMMILGCDADTVIRQLFNPLAIQVVHWFTRTDAKNYGDIVLRIIAVRHSITFYNGLIITMVFNFTFLK